MGSHWQFWRAVADAVVLTDAAWLTDELAALAWRFCRETVG